RVIPGVRTIESAASSVERFVLRDVKRRLDRLELEPPKPAAAPTPGPSIASAADAPPPLSDAMDSLLKRSIDPTPAESLAALHRALLAELVPDEARILAALSDGSSYPMVHVAEATIGSNQRRVLQNASSVGRAAGVALPNQTPVYVSHLRRLG